MGCGVAVAVGDGNDQGVKHQVMEHNLCEILIFNGHVSFFGGEIQFKKVGSGSEL